MTPPRRSAPETCRVAARLSAHGVTVCAIGRSASKLESLRRELAPDNGTAYAVRCDLDRDEDILALGSQLERMLARVDILIHSAGAITMAPLESTSAANFDAHYRVNVRAPFLLTRALLPMLKSARGQIVFVNSSLGVRVKECAGAYAASKHALKAPADTLRLELNASGVRVVSVFPGNTATEMQRQVCRETGKPYAPADLLQPDDVAQAVVHALTLPPNATLTDVYLLPAHRPPS